MTENKTADLGEAASYHSYLFRLWRHNRQAPWQASLQSTATEQVIHFTSLEQLWAFLQKQLGLEADSLPAALPLPDAHDQSAESATSPEADSAAD
jgi:hypothetical protein